MSQGPDIDRFVKDPSLLVDLCREVIERLNAGNDNTEIAPMEAQLREIAKAVEKLEKSGIPVPDAWRAEKTRLAAALGIKTETLRSLRLLANGLQAVCSELSDRIGMPSTSPIPKKVGKPTPRGPAKQTSQSMMMSYLIEALTELGGAAHCNDVLRLMEGKLRGKFLPEDLEKDHTFGVKWKHNAHFARLKLANDGIMIKDSPRGYWQLSKRAK